MYVNEVSRKGILLFYLYVSQLTLKIMNEKLTAIISPVLDNEISIREQKLALNKMFALAVANAPGNETDNFTAKQLMPTFLGLCELLENIKEVQ